MPICEIENLLWKQVRFVELSTNHKQVSAYFLPAFLEGFWGLWASGLQSSQAALSCTLPRPGDPRLPGSLLRLWACTGSLSISKLPDVELGTWKPGNANLRRDGLPQSSTARLCRLLWGQAPDGFQTFGAAGSPGYSNLAAQRVRWFRTLEVLDSPAPWQGYPGAADPRIYSICWVSLILSFTAAIQWWVTLKLTRIMWISHSCCRERRGAYFVSKPQCFVVS